SGLGQHTGVGGVDARRVLSSRLCIGRRRRQQNEDGEKEDGPRSMEILVHRICSFQFSPTDEAVIGTKASVTASEGAAQCGNRSQASFEVETSTGTTSRSVLA